MPSHTAPPPIHKARRAAMRAATNAPSHHHGHHAAAAFISRTGRSLIQPRKQPRMCASERAMSRLRSLVKVRPCNHHTHTEMVRALSSSGSGGCSSGDGGAVGLGLEVCGAIVGGSARACTHQPPCLAQYTYHTHTHAHTTAFMALEARRSSPPLHRVEPTRSRGKAMVLSLSLSLRSPMGCARAEVMHQSWMGEALRSWLRRWPSSWLIAPGAQLCWHADRQ